MLQFSRLRTDVSTAELALTYETIYDNNFFLFSLPRVAIQRMFGNVEIAKCTCVQRSGGRCCHIAALLFLIKDVRYGTEPKMRKLDNISVTSKLQSWGKGIPLHSTLSIQYIFTTSSEIELLHFTLACTPC